METKDKVSQLELARHRKEGDLWLAIEGVVYNVSEFKDHPGGVEVLLEHAGKDATEAFLSKGHSSQARMRLPKYRTGVLVQPATWQETGYTVERRKPKGIGNCVKMVLAILVLLYLVYRLF